MNTEYTIIAVLLTYSIGITSIAVFLNDLNIVKQKAIDTYWINYKYDARRLQKEVEFLTKENKTLKEEIKLQDIRNKLTKTAEMRGE